MKRRTYDSCIMAKLLFCKEKGNVITFIIKEKKKNADYYVF